jgi:hypothetical protein
MRLSVNLYPVSGIYLGLVFLRSTIRKHAVDIANQSSYLDAEFKTPIFMTNLETRVASLEKSIRFYQFLLSGIVLIALAFTVTSFKNNQVPEKITAKAFEVVDANGKVLVSLSSYNGNGSVTTYDKNGNYLVDILSNTSGFGNINLYDGKGKTTMQLYNVKGGGGALAIKNKDGKDAVMLSLMTSGSGHISMNNAVGNPLIWLGETLEKNADLKMYNNSGRQTLRMASTNVSDGSIECYSNQGVRMVYMTTDVNGDGSISTFNKTGTKSGKVPQ